MLGIGPRHGCSQACPAARLVSAASARATGTVEIITTSSATETINEGAGVKNVGASRAEGEGER